MRTGAGILGLLFACGAQAFPSASYFPLPDGATWTYSSPQYGMRTETVVGSMTFNGNTVKIVRDGLGNETYYTNDAQGVRLHGGFFPDPVEGNETDTYTPPVPLAAADAAIGLPVNGAGTVIVQLDVGGFGVSYSSTSVPAGFESVTVPAGAFANALRVQTTINLSFGAETWYQSIQVWLVPGIGVVKRVLYDSSEDYTETSELASYNVPDTIPDAFSFAPKTVPAYLLATSDPITVTGIDVPASISVSGGQYSIDGGPATFLPGTVANNQQVTVSLFAPAPGGSASVTLNIGGVTADFTVTVIADTTPNPFGFVPADGVPPGVAISSNVLKVSGTDTAAPISIGGGEYAIGLQPYTSAPGFVPAGEGVRVRVVSSTTPGATVSATLTIGGVSGSFSVTTDLPEQGPRTVLYFDSQTGEPIGWGDRRIFRLPQAPLPGVTTTLAASRNFSDGVSFTMTQSMTGPPTDSFSLDLDAPGTGPLLPGRYEGAVRFPFNGAGAGLSFSGNGAGCNTLTGRFDVLEAVYAANGDVVRFAANFEQTCDFFTAALLGQVRYNSTVPLGSNAIMGRKADFSGDGRSDILWRNGASGENYLYPMNGAMILGTEGYLRTVADTAWQVAGTGDFDGDGNSDIVWRNSNTGENYVYFMNGLSIVNEGYLRTVADQNWQVAGVGDFDGNGRTDILWRNATSGANYVYLMQGVNIAGEGYLRTVADPNWQIKGVGDFDGDGKADIVWRNAVSGENYAYLMQGTSIAGEGYLRTVADLNWQIVALGDYDGDGKNDLLWRNASTGQNYLYPMDGTAIKPGEGYIRTVPAGNWSVIRK